LYPLDQLSYLLVPRVFSSANSFSNAQIQNALHQVHSRPFRTRRRHWHPDCFRPTRRCHHPLRLRRRLSDWYWYGLLPSSQGEWFCFRKDVTWGSRIMLPGRESLPRRRHLQHDWVNIIKHTLLWISRVVHVSTRNNVAPKLYSPADKTPFKLTLRQDDWDVTSHAMPRMLCCTYSKASNPRRPRQFWVPDTNESSVKCQD